MPTGFGNAPTGRPDQGLRADAPLPNTGDDLHAIRRRFCGPKTMDVQAINVAANVAVRFDRTGTAINGFYLTTATGQLNVYLGDFTGGSGKLAVTPHFVGSASISPTTEFFPVAPATDYIFTVQEGTGAAGGATGTIIFVYQ